jgi:hypothetical protein
LSFQGTAWFSGTGSDEARCEVVMIERYVFLRLKNEHAHQRELMMNEIRWALARVLRVTADTVG